MPSEIEKLPEHHRAWLNAHPERSVEWFRARIAEGFDVHHVNGNPADNSPANLVMIEHADHMRLHDMPMFDLKRLNREQCAGRPEKRKRSQYERVYNRRTKDLVRAFKKEFKRAPDQEELEMITENGAARQWYGNRYGV